MRTIGKPDGGGGAADFLHRHRVLEVAHAGAAELFFHRNAQYAERPQLPPQIGREIVVAVDGRRARRDLIGGKILDLAAQHLRGLAEIEIERAHPVAAHLAIPCLHTHVVM